jgi:hypothetical protein
MTSTDDPHVAGVSEGGPAFTDDPAEAIDRTLQMLFSCCLTLCRASRTSDADKSTLIDSAIESLDTSIRVLRGTAAALH